MHQTTRTAEVSATLTYRTTKTLPAHIADAPSEAAEFVRDLLINDDLDSLTHLLGFELDLSQVTTTIAAPAHPASTE